MLCLIGGGGSEPPKVAIPPLLLDLSCGGLAGLLAMAAQDVGLERDMLRGVPLLPVATEGPPPITEPTALTPEPEASPVPIFSPTMPCSRLFMPGALLRVSLWNPLCPSGTRVPPRELGG